MEVAMTNDFEREVIDRLARIETKIEKMDVLEKRVARLEASDNKRKGMMIVCSGICALVGALLGILGGKLI